MMQLRVRTSKFPVKTKGFAGGYALMEILLAFGIAVVVIVAMVSLAVVTVKAAAINRAYAEAGKVAQSQAERLKQYRDTSTWAVFTEAISDAGGCPTQCKITSSGGFLSLVGGIGEVGTGPAKVSYRFYTVPASPTALDKEVKYTVVATWNISNVAKNYRIEGLLSDWKSL